MRTLINSLFAFAAVALVTSCNSKKKPNYQYFPNMYESVAYEAYSAHDIFSENDNSEALKPVDGTVHRGWLPYDYENSPKGYAKAKASLKNPIQYTKENEATGMQLYTIYCAICHGDKGNGKGTLVKREKILGVPSYDDVGRAITEGSIYHVMYWGINSMGSYASQTSIEERWQIVQYVQSLKAKLEGKTPRIDKAALVAINNEEAILGQQNVIRLSDEADLDHDGTMETHNDDGDGEKEKVSHSKKDLLGGKSHHSHKEAGKK
ncbi:c-type cytochrome [Aquimarina agarivorans]|uniref:c-type cytochrome n=1 Tax=Aquimarina agarivorans TaxID=980584 RepID=UPI000248FCB6|nr:cytochrome c [Aquimarina agarivorans]